MPSYEDFKQEVNELMANGCSFDKAFQDTLNQYPQLASEADKALIIKQKIARENQGRYK